MQKLIYSVTTYTRYSFGVIYKNVKKTVYWKSVRSYKLTVENWFCLKNRSQKLRLYNIYLEDRGIEPILTLLYLSLGYHKQRKIWVWMNPARQVKHSLGLNLVQSLQIKREYYGRSTVFNLRAMINKHFSCRLYSVSDDLVTGER